METYASMLISLTTITFANCKPLTDLKNIDLPEKYLSTPQLIKYWGYPAETHTVITEDGYYLTIHRIPHGKINSATPPQGERPVFFLQHGLLGSSSSWVINLPHQSLGYLLADAGYDVWMGNARGNTYSKKHSFHQINSSAFWSFSFAEHAKYDLPAMINYVLEATRQKQLYYVGHSMGCMMPFIELSNDMELQNKIKLAFLLAPPSRMGNVISPVKYIANYISELTLLASILGIREVFPSSKYNKELYYRLCTYIPALCDAIEFTISGYDLKYLNNTRLPVYMTHLPAGTSVKNVIHFGQLINSKKFQTYDYGVIGNLWRYRQRNPPQYYIGNINVPIVLFYGTEDWLIPPVDVEWTFLNLPNVIDRIKINGYNHMDFLWATNAKFEIHDKIISMARTFNTEF